MLQCVLLHSAYTDHQRSAPIIYEVSLCTPKYVHEWIASTIYFLSGKSTFLSRALMFENEAPLSYYYDCCLCFCVPSQGKDHSIKLLHSGEVRPQRIQVIILFERSLCFFCYQWNVWRSLTVRFQHLLSSICNS